MKLPKELINGIIIFIGIGAYFLLMELIGVADVYYLRFLNILFLFYGTKRTLDSNHKEGKIKIFSNGFSALLTSLSGVFFSIIGLILYSYARGGDAYVQTLSRPFLFGGDPTVSTYAISLLFEGIVSAVIVSFILMLSTNRRYKTD